MTETEGNLLAVENLKVSYKDKAAVEGISFSMKPSEVLAIVGESGSGKSTILKTVIGLLGKEARAEGSVRLRGRELLSLSDRERRGLNGRGMAMIFQNAGASFCPIRRIGTQITESIRAHEDWSREQIRARAEELMDAIGLEHSVWNAYPFALSGGMGQRAGILSAMMLSPELLLADEPTSALDTVTQMKVVRELLKVRKKENSAILLVTHHMGVARCMADKVLVMKKGRAVEYGTAEQIFCSPQEAYTKSLIKAVPCALRKECVC
ncbi:MAG: ABC transporter ATP-binding protein [Schwartzia sp.]|nr:ABC transporter ATP-binding protein [Schwartzia sp. (in: firmicutes)]